MAIQFDIGLAENNNGGDVIVTSNDLVKFYENEGQIYLALFGGNVEANTPDFVTPGTERLDYFGNHFLQKENQFNSNTERVLNTTSLGSQGISKIQAAVESDLYYLKKYATITIQVTLDGINRVRVEIRVIYFTGKKTLAVFTYTPIPAGLNSDGDFNPLDFYTQDFF